MAVVQETTTRVNMKYAANSSKGLSAYSLGIEVKNDAADDAYFALASAITPMVNADDRECEEVTLTITKVIE